SELSISTATTTDVCPAALDVVYQYLSGPYKSYMKAIAPFATTTLMKKGASKLKKCVVQHPPLILMSVPVPLSHRSPSC
uniref:Uncharacterized protein n=1 Tax=Anolis carolinensis TaxID=28377 RepID=A0A803TPE9_ANOCA